MSDTTSQQLVVFSLGSEEYALPIGAVHEIIRFSEPRSVASEVAWIRGVIGLRGKIIPIFDLAARLELPATGATESGKIVILETGSDQVGVMVDEVEEVLTVSGEQLEDVPSASSDSIEAIGTPPPYGELSTSGLNIVSRVAALPCSATQTERLT